jgi:hypothetical protein
MNEGIISNTVDAGDNRLFNVCYRLDDLVHIFHEIYTFTCTHPFGELFQRTSGTKGLAGTGQNGNTALLAITELIEALRDTPRRISDS